MQSAAFRRSYIWFYIITLDQVIEVSIFIGTGSKISCRTRGPPGPLNENSRGPA